MSRAGIFLFVNTTLKLLLESTPIFAECSFTKFATLLQKYGMPGALQPRSLYANKIASLTCLHIVLFHVHFLADEEVHNNFVSLKYITCFASLARYQSKYLQ
jgi:hypothetical protein